MVPEVDAVLRSLLADVGAPCTLGLPGEDWSGEPAISLLLHSVSEDTDARVAAQRDLRDGTGRVIGRADPLRRFWFSYWVTAWASHPETEHALIGAVLEAVCSTEIVPTAHLGERLLATGDTVMLSVARPDDDSAVPLWHALGIGPRPVLPVHLVASVHRASDDVAEPPSEVDLGFADPLRSATTTVPPAARPRPTRRITEGAR